MSSNPLARLEAATTALAQSSDLIEVRQIRDIALAAAHYARAARLGIEAQNHAAEIKIRAERKAGELLAELERGHGPGRGKTSDIVSDVLGASEYQQAIEAADIHERQARRYQQIAKIPDPTFEQTISETKAAGDELTSAAMQKMATNGKVTAAHVASVVGTFSPPPHVTVVDEWGSQETTLTNGDKPHVSNNSGNNEWYTPPDYIERARAVMGCIDLDPASSAIANQTVGATKYYTERDNGLDYHWRGKVWMNPPYATALIKQFIDKLADHVAAGDVSEAIVLTNNATETAWFGVLADIGAAACFPSSRVRFLRPNGETGAPLQGQAIIYIGDNVSLFFEKFNEVGWCAKISKRC